MTIIEQIFDALGEATAIASETGDPVQTVHSWKANDEIPPWRRASILDLARRKTKQLSPEAIAYLTSSDRKPRVRRSDPSDTPEPTQAAA